VNLGNESEVVEFKKSTSELKEGIISLVSMLNKNNEGTLYFGVDNAGNVIGQEIGKDTLRTISQVIANSIEPKIIPTINTLTDFSNNLDYIEVKVKGIDIPYSTNGIYYIRSSNEDRKAPRESLRKMFIGGGFDFIKEAPSYFQDLSFTTFISLLVSKGYHVTSLISLIKAKELKNNDNKYNVMAELLSDNNLLSLKVVRFKGKDKLNLVQRKEYGHQCLLLGVNQAMDYIKTLNETNVDLSGGVRKDTSLFDFSSFAEAWKNACVHNSWIDMTPPAIYIYDDRLEIVSYGGLPYGLTLEEFYKGSSHPINKALWSIFNSLDLAEQTGHGVPTIISHYGKEAIAVSENFIMVTIPFSFKPTWALSKNTIKGLSKEQDKIVKMIEENPYTKINEMIKETCLSASGVKWNLNKLKSFGIIHRDGAKKNGKWVLD